MPKNSLGEVAQSLSIPLSVLGQIGGRAADVIIIPVVSAAGTFNVSDKQDLFNAGAKAASEALPQIRRELAEKGIILPASP